MATHPNSATRRRRQRGSSGRSTTCGSAGIDNPYWPDLDFRDENMSVRHAQYFKGAGKDSNGYVIFGNYDGHVTFTWRMSKDDFEARGFDNLCGSDYRVQLRK